MYFSCVWVGGGGRVERKKNERERMCGCILNQDFMNFRDL